MRKFLLPVALTLTAGAAIATAETPPRDLPNLDLRTSGRVVLVAQQANGKLVVAGDYSEVGSAAASVLARLDADGSLDTSWNPHARYAISALAISDDDNLYAASWAGGVVKIPLSGTGAVDPAFDFTDGWDIAESIVIEGDYLYAAVLDELRRYSLDTGTRDTGWIGTRHDRGLVSDRQGHVYSGVARVHIADGSDDASWTPPEIPGEIFATALSNDGYLYVAAESDIGGVAQELARLPVSGQGAPDPAWHPIAASDATASSVDAVLPLDDGSIIVSGRFQRIGGLARENVARLAGPAGAADPAWNADTDGEVLDLAGGPAATVIAAGTFTRAGGALRASVARLGGGGVADASYAPGFYDTAIVETIVPDATHGRFYVGGRFDWAGAERHRNVLRLDAAGHLDSTWAPAVDAPPTPSSSASGVHAIAVAPSFVYIGGLFESVDGVARRSLARIGEAAPGVVDAAWDPALFGTYFGASDPLSSIDAMLIDAQSRLVVGGDFRSVGGTPLGALVRFDASGTLDPTWNPDVGYPVTRMASDGADALFPITLDPQFAESRPHKVSLSSGELDLAWDDAAAALEGAFDIVAAGSHDLFVAGGISFVDAHVVRVSQQTGAVEDDWSAITRCVVLRVALDGTHVYGAGYESTDTSYRACVERFDGNGVIDASFDPLWTDAFSDTHALAVGGGAVYVGGQFDSVGGVERRAIVAFDGLDALLDDGFDP